MNVQFEPVLKMLLFYIVYIALAETLSRPPVACASRQPDAALTTTGSS